VHLSSGEIFGVGFSEGYVTTWYYFVAELGKLNKVHAIKLIRSEFDCGLKEAKDFVEDAMEEIS